ncbi:MAG TPA: hypothetical protein VES02_06465, partial [Dermatophilaceae bacterium]|nr:hypothetical protein [Dermatophilaceae bacterium]
HDLEVGLSSESIAATLTVTVMDGFDTVLPGEPVIAASDAQFSARLGRPIPVPRPVKPYSRVSTIGELSDNPVGKALRAVSLQVAGHSKADPVTVRMIERTVVEMPLRAMVLFSQGKIGFSVIDAVIDTLNGRPDKPVLGGAKAFAGWATRLIGRA